MGRVTLVHWASSEASIGGGIDPWALRCWIAAWSSVWRCGSWDFFKCVGTSEGVEEGSRREVAMTVVRGAIVVDWRSLGTCVVGHVGKHVSGGCDPGEAMEVEICKVKRRGCRRG